MSRRLVYVVILVVGLLAYRLIIVPLLPQPRMTCNLGPLPGRMLSAELQLTEISDLETITASNLHRLERVAVINFAENVHGWYRVVFSPDSTILATSGVGYVYDNVSTILWNLAETEPCFGIAGEHNRDETLIAFSPDSRYFITKSCIHTLDQLCYHLWDVSSLSPIASFEYTEYVNFPDGYRLAYLNPGEQERQLWNTDNLPVSSETNARLFSPDNRLFVTTSRDATISLWHTDNGERVADFFSGFWSEIAGESVTGLIFSPDGRWVASKSRYLRIWNTETGELQIEPELSLFTDEFEFTSDSQRLGYGSGIWDVETADIMFDFGEGVFNGFNADETFYAVIEDFRTHFLSTATGELLLTPDVERSVADIDFSANGQLIAVATHDLSGIYPVGYVEVWGVRNQRTAPHSLE